MAQGLVIRARGERLFRDFINALPDKHWLDSFRPANYSSHATLRRLAKQPKNPPRWAAERHLGTCRLKTGMLFHELFRQWPALALHLAGLDPALAGRYGSHSEELKQKTTFWLDGLPAPAEDRDDPYSFIKVRIQPEDTLYPRLFAELTLFLLR